MRDAPDLLNKLFITNTKHYRIDFPLFKFRVAIGLMYDIRTNGNKFFKPYFTIYQRIYRSDLIGFGIKNIVGGPKKVRGLILGFKFPEMSGADTIKYTYGNSEPTVERSVATKLHA